MRTKTPKKSSNHARAGRSASKGGPHATRKAVAKPKRRKRAVPRTWQQVFLLALSVRPVVSYAADLAGVEATTPYHYRNEHPEFAEQWKAALEKGIQRGESEAWRRAVEGYLKPVFQGGHEVGKVREFSDQLLMFMLRAHKPETYRERVDVGLIERRAEQVAKDTGLSDSDISEIITIARRLAYRASQSEGGRS